MARARAGDLILPTWEILFNHYVTRKGRAMPSTAALLPRVRAGGSYTDLQRSWETLTHAGVGSVGLELPAWPLEGRADPLLP